MGLPVKYNVNAERVNEDGDFESHESQQGVDTWSPEYGSTTTLKIMVASFLFRSNIDPKAKIILLLRTPSGVVKSQGDVGMGQPDPKVRRNNYFRLMAQMGEWIGTHRNPLLFVDTDDLIQNPEPWFRKTAAFVGVDPERALEASALIKPFKSQAAPEDIEDAAWSIYKSMRAQCYINT